MGSRKLIVFFASVFIVIGFFNLKQYRDWFEERILAFDDEFYDQRELMSLSKRKMVRWGPAYETCNIITDVIKKNGTKNPLLLLPSPAYATKFSQTVVTEPVIMYYFTGLKGTTGACKDVYKANYCLLVGEGGQPSLVTITDSNQLNRILKEYEVAQQ